MCVAEGPLYQQFLLKWAVFTSTASVGARSVRWMGVATDFRVGGRIVVRWLTYTQNTLKIGKVTGFGPLHFRIWRGRPLLNLPLGGTSPPRPPRFPRPWVDVAKGPLWQQFLLEAPVLIASVEALSGKCILLRERFSSSLFLVWAVFTSAASVWAGPLR